VDLPAYTSASWSRFSPWTPPTPTSWLHPLMSPLRNFSTGKVKLRADKLRIQLRGEGWMRCRLAMDAVPPSRGQRVSRKKPLRGGLR